MPWLYSGLVIREGRAWTDNDGIQHPSNWNKWSDEEKTAKGMVWEDPAPTYDNRYYTGDGTPKSLDDVTDEDGNVVRGLKSIHKEQIKVTANSLLAPTDWYIIRDLERGVAVPTEVAEFRTAVLTAAQDIEDAIDAATDIDEFKAIYENTSDEDGNVTVAVGNDWPKL